MKKNNKLCLSVLMCILFVAVIALVACNNTGHTITYVTNGGTEIAASQFKKGKSITPPTTTKQYFTFDGWYADAELTTEFTQFDSMPDSDVTVYAKWLAGESGRIRFETNGGSVIDEIVGVVGQSVPSVTAPTKAGYTFVGWYTDVELTQFYVLGTIPAGELTLYARWSKDTANYKFVTYVLNGVSNEVPVVGGSKAREPSMPTDLECIWYADNNYTAKYDFNSNVNSDVTLYGLAYSKGLTIANGTVTKYEGSSNNIYIPEKYNGQTVTAVGNGAFERKTSIQYVNLPHTVTEIGDYAFYKCEYIVNVNLTANITTIGKFAFADCVRMAMSADLGGLSNVRDSAFANCYLLSAVNFGEALTEIGEEAFINCHALANANLPSSVESIGDYAFANCGLTSFTIPASLTSLGNGAVRGCKLTSVTSNSSLVTVSNGTVTNGSALLLYIGTADTYTLSDNIATVAPYAFYGTNIKRLDVSASANALTMSSLEGMSALETLTVQDFDADNSYLAYWFGGRNANASNKIPASLNTITFTAFETASLVDYAFYGAIGLQQINGASNVTEIGAYALANTALTSYNVSSSVVKIDNTAFRGTKTLAEISVDSDNTAFSAYDGALYNKSGETLIYVPEAKTTLNFTETVSVISDGAMYDSKVESLVVPNSVESIGFGAFENMSRLGSLTVPFIGGSVDDNTYMLYIFGATVTETEENGTRISGGKCPVSLRNITITATLTDIPNYAFLYCEKVTEINCGNSYTTIGKAAFCTTGLTEVVVPDSVTTIGEDAYNACANITSVVIGKNVTTIGDGAFAATTKLSSVVFEEGDNDLTIGDYAFYGTVEPSDNQYYITSGLTSIKFSNNIVAIGEEAFYFAGFNGTLVSDGQSLQPEDETFAYIEIIFDVENSRLKSIAPTAFCITGISKVVLPASIETIGANAFADNAALQSVVIGSANNEATALRRIDNGAFAYNAILSSFTLHKSVIGISGVPNLGSEVFVNSPNANIYVPADSVDYYLSAWNSSIYQLASRIFAI